MFTHNHFIALLLGALVSFISCSDPGWSEPFPERLPITVIDSIGVDMGDSCYVLGAIADAAVSPEGSILVLDRSACVIREFSASGISRGLISRRGSGPGEISYPSKLSLFDDGSMMIWDMGKYCITLLDENGESIRDIVPSELIPPMQPVALEGDRYGACSVTFNMDGDDGIVIISPSVFDLETSEPELRLFRDTMRFNADEALTNPGTTGLMGSVLMCSNGRDRLFYTRISSSSYEVRGFSTSGDTLFCASLDLPQAAKTPEEIQDEEQYFASMLGLGEFPSEIEIQGYHNMVAGIGVDDAGLLWVQRGTESKPVFDVFNSQGDHVATAEFPIQGRFWRFSITPFGALAWNNDPLDGVQKVYIMELPAVN